MCDESTFDCHCVRLAKGKRKKKKRSSGGVGSGGWGYLLPKRLLSNPCRPPHLGNIFPPETKAYQALFFAIPHDVESKIHPCPCDDRPRRCKQLLWARNAATPVAAWQAESTGDGLPKEIGKESYLYEGCKERTDTCMNGHVFDYARSV